jgi:tetratricopeptide (TPR) repeat protein
MVDVDDVTLQQFLLASLAALLATWLWLRTRRCCGRPDACPRLEKHSAFLRRCLENPSCARACRHALPTLAMRLVREGAVGHALACAGRAANEGCPGAWIVLGRMHDEMGNGALARELYRRELELDQYSLAAWLALGDHYAKAGEYNEALHHYRRAAESDSTFAESWCSLGRCYAALEHWDDARVCYEIALRREPEHLPTMHALGLVLVGAGDFREAMRLFEEILDIAGPSGALLARLGRLAREAGDFRRAVVYLKDAMKLSGMPDVKKDMAEVYAAMGQVEIAEFYRQEYEKEYVI